MKPIGFWMQQALGAWLLQRSCFSRELFLASPQPILEQIQSLFRRNQRCQHEQSLRLRVPEVVLGVKEKKKNAASKQAASGAEGGKVLSSPRAPSSTNRVQTNETHDDPRLHPILPKLPTKA